MLVLLAAGCGGGARRWHVGAHAIYSWASTIRYRDCVNCVPPHKTLAALPPDGIVIQLATVRERASRDIRRWAPRIRAGDVLAGFEGEPPRIGVFQLAAQKGRTYRTVFVWFGRAHPTHGQVAKANAELARLSF